MHDVLSLKVDQSALAHNLTPCAWLRVSIYFSWQASKHPFVTGEPFTCPYKPPLETARLVSDLFSYWFSNPSWLQRKFLLQACEGVYLDLSFQRVMIPYCVSQHSLPPTYLYS